MNDNDLTDVAAGQPGGGGSDIIKRIIRRRWWQILLIAIVISSGGMALTLAYKIWPDTRVGELVPPHYTSVAKVLIEAGDARLSEDAGKLINPYKGRRAPDRYFNTRLSIMRSSRVLGGAIGQLRSSKPWAAGLKPEDFQEFAEDFGIMVNEEPDTHIAVVSATAPRPDQAQDIVEAVVGAFKEIEATSRVNAVEEARDQLSRVGPTGREGKLEDAAEEMRRLTSEADAFAKRYNIGGKTEQREKIERVFTLRDDAHRADVDFRARLVETVSTLEAVIGSLGIKEEGAEENATGEGEAGAAELERGMRLRLDTVADKLKDARELLVGDNVTSDSVNQAYVIVGRQKDELEAAIADDLARIRAELETVDNSRSAAGTADDAMLDKVVESKVNLVKLNGEVRYLQDEINKLRSQMDLMRRHYANVEETYPPYKEAEQRKANLEEKLDKTLAKVREYQGEAEKARREQAVIQMEKDRIRERRHDTLTRAELQRQMQLQKISDAWPAVEMAKQKSDKLNEEYNLELPIVRRIDEYQDMVAKVDEATETHKKLDERLERLNDSLKTLEAYRAEDKVIRVVEPASYPVSPKLTKRIAFPVIGGLFMGFAFAFWRERGDSSMKSPDQARETLRMPVLGSLPKVKSSGAVSKGRVMLGGHGRYISELEYFRHLRSKLLHTYCGANGSGIRSIVVSSATAKEGKTTVAVNLAISLAQAGKRILMIDADLHRPKVHQYFSIDNGPGLSEILAGEAQFADVVQTTEEDEPDVLTAGVSPQHPGELFEKGSFKDILKEARGSYDLMIVDSPPVIGPATSLQVAHEGDGLLFVVRSGKVKKDTLSKTCSSLRQMEVNMLGMVFNYERKSKEEQKSYTDYYRARA